MFSVAAAELGRPEAIVGFLPAWTYAKLEKENYEGKRCPSNVETRDYVSERNLQFHDIYKSESNASRTISDHLFKAYFPKPIHNILFPRGPAEVIVGMDFGSERPKLRLALLGPFALTDEAGRSFAPKAQKERALLALLALAPRGERSRVWLRDKLWSDRGEEQASASLRQALVQLRKDLGASSHGLIEADRHVVSLDLSKIEVDARLFEEQGPDADKRTLPLGGLAPEFLEGLDIADPEFEEWLRAERRRWTVFFEDRSTTPPARSSPEPGAAVASQCQASRDPDPSASEPALAAEGIGLGLLPNIVHGTDAEIAALADIVVESVARNVQELLSLDTYDFREAGRPAWDVETHRGADYLIRIRLLQVGTAVTLTLFVYHATVTRLLWSQSIQSTTAELFRDGNLILSGFINQNVDRLASMIVSAESHPPALDHHGRLARTSYVALNSMYRLDAGATIETDRLLMAAHRERPDSLFKAMLAYNNSFRIGENLGAFDDEQRQLALEFADDAESMAPFNSMTLACLGHVRGFVLGDHDRAGDLLAHAVEVNPLQAFAWDHYALHKIYTGDYAEATRAARRAVQLGSYNPLRYTYETTLCMAATLAGDFLTAIHFGKRALSRQPRFTAAMRYLVTSYHDIGLKDEARATLDRLTEIVPDFSQAMIARTGLGLIDEHAKERLLSAFVATGLKKG